MDPAQLNIVAILAAALASFAIGGLWYSQLLFGNLWMRQAKISEEMAASANMVRTFGLAFVAALVIACNLAIFLGSGIGATAGALYGFLAGLGWVAMAFAINDLFEQRPLRLFLVNAGYHTVAFTVMGLIIGAWQ